MKKYIIRALQLLAQNNRVFCSEADFQFALSWEIQKLLPKAIIVLENGISVNEKVYYVDIIVKLDSKYYYIELKYQTSKSKVKDVFGEELELKNQAAEDLMRYDYLKDILRLYEIAKAHADDFGGGYAIILSNDKLMYDAPLSFKKTLDYQFRIHDRRGVEKNMYPIPGMIAWNNNSKPLSHWTNKGERTNWFILPSISTEWDLYRQIIDDNNNKQVFKYLINEVQFQSLSIVQSSLNRDI